MSFEMNKVAAAILVALILAMVSGILADKLVEPEMLTKNVYQVGPSTAAPAAAENAAPAGPEPIAPLMAAASVDAGKEVAKKCEQCHTFTKGGPNRIGPDLYGIVGDKIANGRGGYNFSSALKGKQGETWTLANLNHWLWKPQSFASGTKMTFIGLPKAKDRANVIAFLNSNSDKPESLQALAATGEKPAAKPAAGAKPAANGEKPAAGAKPAANEAKPAAGAAPAAGEAKPAANEAKPAAPASGAAPAAKPAAPAPAPTGSAKPAPANAAGK